MSEYTKWYANHHHLITEKAHEYVVGIESQLMERDQRIAELEAENKELKKRQDIFEKELRETWDYEDSHINELLEVLQPPKEGSSDGGSLLKKAGHRPPKGCYCKSGKCMAPKPEWCRDAKKRDALQPPKDSSDD